VCVREKEIDYKLAVVHGWVWVTSWVLVRKGRKVRAMQGDGAKSARQWI
jgi:hypothetical protein